MSKAEEKATATLDASWLRHSFRIVNEMTGEMQGLILGQEQNGLTYLINNSKLRWGVVCVCGFCEINK